MRRIAMTVIIALLVTGCKTTERVAVERTDTVAAYHADTVRLWRERTLHDTIRIYEERVLTLNEGGDTIRVTNTYLQRERIIERDTASLQAARTDSTRHAAATAIEERRERGGGGVPLLAVGVICGALLSMVVAAAGLRR